jgi:hypothetical protein
VVACDFADRPITGEREARARLQLVRVGSRSIDDMQRRKALA